MSERWSIRGYLETRAPLHIGSGETGSHPLIVRDVRVPAGGPSEKKPVEIALVASAAVGDGGEQSCGRPYLPATSVRGALRRWFEHHGFDPKCVARAFGEAGEPGGLLRFHDSFLRHDAVPTVAPSFWRPERGTGVVAHVSLDRRSRTASDQRLFHLEVVPAEQRFDLEITVFEDLAAVALVLHGLETLEKDHGARLGAGTADGWGRVAWHCDGIFYLGHGQIGSWLAKGANEMVEEAFVPLDLDQQAALEAAKAVLQPAYPSARGRLDLRLAIEVEGPFLVQDTDPTRAGRGAETPNRVPRRDHEERTILPATSLRGALRNQAERILRTIGGLGAACGPGSPRSPCSPVGSLDQISSLCPACQTFGAAGWRTPVRLTDFRASVATPDSALRAQEHVAIDRFTGGAADERKFRVCHAAAPRLEGSFAIDLDALCRAGVGAWSLALLALVLRDLDEGDVALGGGAARGYGRVAGVEVSVASAQWWESIPRRSDESEEDPQPPLEGAILGLGGQLAPYPDLVGHLDEAYRKAMQTWLRDLTAVAEAAHEDWYRSLDDERKEALA